MTIMANPRQFKIPDWLLKRKKDYKDGKYSQVTSNALDIKLRDDLERLEKIRLVLFPSFVTKLISFIIFLYVSKLTGWYGCKMGLRGLTRNTLYPILFY